MLFLFPLVNKTGTRRETPLDVFLVVSLQEVYSATHCMCVQSAGPLPRLARKTCAAQFPLWIRMKGCIAWTTFIIVVKLL